MQTFLNSQPVCFAWEAILQESFFFLVFFFLVSARPSQHFSTTMRALSKSLRFRSISTQNAIGLSFLCFFFFPFSFCSLFFPRALVVCLIDLFSSRAHHCCTDLSPAPSWYVFYRCCGVFLDSFLCLPVWDYAVDCNVFDMEGKQYLDFLAAYSAVNQVGGARPAFCDPPLTFP